MRKGVFGLIFAAVAACSVAFASLALAADYPQPMYQPPAYYPPPPVQTSCCCPTVRRGFFWNFSSCGYRNNYGEYPQYQQPYPQYQYQQSYQAAPAYYPQQQPYESYQQQPYQPYQQQTYYQPGYAPQVGVGVGIGGVGVGVGVGVGRVGVGVDARYPRRNCFRRAGRLICR